MHSYFICGTYRFSHVENPATNHIRWYVMDEERKKQIWMIKNYS